MAKAGFYVVPRQHLIKNISYLCFSSEDVLIDWINMNRFKTGGVIYRTMQLSEGR
jgi:hypothetical protein